MTEHQTKWCRNAFDPLGAPGAGKGTQAAYLKDEWGLTAYLDRRYPACRSAREGTILGKEAQGYMERGELVPDDLIIRMMEARPENIGRRTGYILDGFPRTVAQAEAFDGDVTRIGQQLDAVVDLEVADTELIRRSSGRRVCPNAMPSTMWIPCRPKRGYLRSLWLGIGPTEG